MRVRFLNSERAPPGLASLADTMFAFASALRVNSVHRPVQEAADNNRTSHGKRNEIPQVEMGLSARGIPPSGNRRQTLGKQRAKPHGVMTLLETFCFDISIPPKRP